MKVSVKYLLATVLSCGLLFPGVSQAAYKFKLGNSGAPNHHYTLSCLEFAKRVKDQTKGEIDIEVFPNDQLGSQRQLTEGVQIGTVDMVLTSDSQLSAFEDAFGILAIPFLFRDIDHVSKVMDGPIGEWFSKQAEKKGMVILGYWENGFRQMSNSKRPINTPEDLKGLKLRAPNSFVSVESFRMLGMAPAPMASGEIYSALQLGTVDGQENAVGRMITDKVYEVQKYVSMTSHMHTTEPLVISKVIFDNMAPELQKILKEEGLAMAAYSRNLADELEKGQIEEMKKLIAVNYPDRKPFMEASKPIYDFFRTKFDYPSFRKEFNAHVIDAIIAVQ
jgi:tripartite ATP-independent transporter DctP family solute receptor